MLARLGQPAEAWQSLEEDLGRGLLDELAARQDQRLAPAERARLRELTAALERLDKLVEATPKGLDQAERAKRFEELKRQRELASIALGEFQTKLVQDHKALAGEVARLNEIQAALPADAALVAWVDIAPAGPNAADPDGEHWGVVVRSRGIPAWIPIAGTGPDGLWTKDDTGLAEPGPDGAAETARRRLGRPAAPGREITHPAHRAAGQGPGRLGRRPAAGPEADRPTFAGHGGHPGRGAARPRRHPDSELCPLGHRVQVPARAAPAGPPCRLAGSGRPGLRASRQSSEPKPLPDHGLLVNVVAPGSNAATHGLKPGDVLLAYNGQALNKKDDLKVVAEGDKPIGVEVWRDGQFVPARSGPRQARRGHRPAAGTGSDRRESGDGQGAGGVARWR